MSALPGDALWRRLREAGIAQGELPPQEAQAPWFVRLMLGVAGWIGALFLFGFFGVALQELLRSTAARLFLGALLCGGAAIVFRSGRQGELVSQFGFAVSLAGQALLASGLGEGLRSPESAALAIALQQAILFLAVPSAAHRVWTSASGGCALAFALGRWGVAPLATAGLTAAFAAASLREIADARHASLVRSAAYGLGVAAFVGALMHGSWSDLLWGRPAAPRVPASLWMWVLASAAVVLGAAALLRREGVALASRTGALAMAGALVVAAASAKAPGLAPASALLVLGHANGNRVLAGFGVLALIGYLAYYYYSLQATLLEKSALLGATGLALVLAWLVMRRLLPVEAPRDA